MKLPPSLGSRSAFSLIELLTVVAIMSILSGLTVLYMGSFGRNQYVSTTASSLASALVQARSEAIARGTLVQLRVIVNDPGDSSTAGRAYSLWVKPRATSGTGPTEYQQITNWIRLSNSVSILQEGVPASPGSSDQNLFDPAITSNRLSGIDFSGREVEVAYVEFSPMGGIRAPSPSSSHAYILVAPIHGGTGNSLADRNSGLSEEEANWRKVRVANLTGQIQVQAPAPKASSGS